ncbi:MAG: type II secretion system F family protein [Nautiliaceae bacterium]
MEFKYKAYTKEGKKIKGKIEANSLTEAKNRLNDLYILEIKPTKTLNLNISKTNKKELSKTLHSLGLYLKASISLISAINLLKSQSSPQMVKFLNELEKSIKEGKSFFYSIENQKILKIPQYIKNSLKIGEESGKLDIILIEMAKFLKEEEKIASKTSQAMIYPMFIVVVSIFMVFFMLSVVVPKIVKVFENLNKDLPLVTKIVISLGNFLQHNWLNILIALGGAAVLIKLSLKKRKIRLLFHKTLLKIPIIKKLIISKELGRFSYLTSTLINSGINYINAVNMATNTLENEYIKEIFLKAIQDVIEGKKLSISLKKAGFDFDKSFLQALSLAEDTSQVDEVLKNISEIYFEENELLSNTLVNLMEPILIIIVGGVIGFIVTAMLLPMFSMSIIN